MPEILLFVYCFIHISSKFQAACFVLFFVQRKDLNISAHFNFFFGDGRRGSCSVKQGADAASGAFRLTEFRSQGISVFGQAYHHIARTAAISGAGKADGIIAADKAVVQVNVINCKQRFNRCLADGGHFAVIAGVFQNDVIDIFDIHQAFGGNTARGLSVVGNIVVENQSQFGGAAADRNVGDFNGVDIGVSRSDADGYRHGDESFGAGMAAGVGGADKGGFVIIIVKKVEQAVVYVLSGHGQFGGSALFAAADDNRIRHFYRRVISAAAVFFKRMVQKVKCALEIAAADGQQGQNRQALFGDNLQHDFIPFVFFMKNLPLS